MTNQEIAFFSPSSVRTIGVISDTHNLLRPQAIEELGDSDLIIHAGDIGERRILEELEMIAPVVAVQGNVDCADWCSRIPLTRTVSVGEVKIYVIHNLKELDTHILQAEVKAVISGHSHKPGIENREDVLYLNPRSAGRRRFKLPISLAKIDISNGQLKARIIELNI